MSPMNWRISLPLLLVVRQSFLFSLRNSMTSPFNALMLSSVSFRIYNNLPEVKKKKEEQ